MAKTNGELSKVICTSHTYGTRTDEQIVGIAKQAFEDTQASYNADLKTYTALVKSWAISVIVKGSTAYISSTFMGGRFFPLYP